MKLNELQNEKVYIELPPFTGRNVPITEIAKAINKDVKFVRQGLIEGFLKFGVAKKIDNADTYSYYCPDKKVWEETGYFDPEK